MQSSDEKNRSSHSAHLRSHIQRMFGVEDTSGVELFSMIQHLANLSEVLETREAGENEISGPRWRLMLRLLAEEQFGNPDGITPTAISQAQRVSKNTVSSLLRGLEDQGLIQRNLDVKDYRIFRIQLTDAGREMVLSTAPRRIESLNKMAAGLEPEEREQLMVLLEKLHHSLKIKTCPK